jgi:hypothetical protein
MQVISASYRTDIPAFYGEWFMERVRAGYVRYHNPYGPQVVEVSLKPEDVHAIVFWSKNYAPFLKHLGELNEHKLDCYFHYAINGYADDAASHPLEERVPRSEQTLKAFQSLVDHYSLRHVQWRYDPIIFTPVTDAEWHRRTFERLAQHLAGLTERCYFSFLDVYGKVTRNVKKLPPELHPFEPTRSEQIDLVRDLAAIASKYGIALYTCAEDFVVDNDNGIQRGSCVDKEILDALWPHKRRKLKLCSNRGKCGCYDSRDIGAYDTCPHGCIYCYAVQNRPLALKRYEQHDRNHYALIRRASDTPPDQGHGQAAQAVQVSLPLTATDRESSSN